MRFSTVHGSSSKKTRSPIILLVTLIALALLSPSLLLSATGAGSTHQNINPQNAGYDVCGLYKCSGASMNWYVVGAQGSWTVPTITSCAANEVSSMSYEVGIDFSADNFDVRNSGGIDLSCANGAISYSAFVIQADVPVALGTQQYPVHPGDHMNAKVTYNRVTSQFSIVLHDATHVWTYKPVAYTDGAQLLIQGLFILGRPCTTSSCPIPHFGTLKTSGDYVTINSGGLSMTKGSVGFWLGRLSSAIPTAGILRFELQDSDTGNVLATTSLITTSSSAFNIIFKNPS